MNKAARICLLMLIVSILAALPALALSDNNDMKRTGPDSFLAWRAYSVESVIDQIEKDPIARKRLAKHFHLSETDLINYFRSELRVVEYKESGWAPVYGVTKTGLIYKAKDYFHAGGKAFGLPDGTPVLKFACGNPLITELPPLPKKKKVVEAVPPIEPEVVPMVEVAPPVQAPEEYALLPGMPLAPGVLVPGPIPLTGSNQLPIWLLLPLLSTGGDDHNPPVPEPATMILFGSGALLLGGQILRRNRR